MQTVTIGNTQIDLPDWLETRVEGDTLFAYPPGTDYANLHLTLITHSKDGIEVPGTGEKIIRRMAIEAGAKLRKQTGKVWFYSTSLSSERPPGSLMHWWYVVMGGYFLTISCFSEAAEKDNVLSKRVLASVGPMIQSFRRKSNNV